MRSWFFHDLIFLSQNNSVEEACRDPDSLNRLAGSMVERLTLYKEGMIRISDGTEFCKLTKSGRPRG
jgi:hypothetical protein